MNFDIPEHLANYLRELDAFIEAQILPLQMQDDNNRFFDHRREDARTDWDKGGLPNEQWEELLMEAKQQLQFTIHGKKTRWIYQMYSSLLNLQL